MPVSAFRTLFGTFSILAGIVIMADASAFRGSSFEAAVARMSVEDLRATMLDELMAALGTGNRLTEQRLSRIEDALRPTFRALPKNAHDRLEHAVVRYALHRFFVQRHAMYVKGLEPGGEAWNSLSPTTILEDRVPAFLQAMFEKRLSGHGFGVHELAILAATLEHLIHNEASARLKASYAAHNVSFEERVSKDQTQQLIETYMVFFIRGQNASAMTPDEVMQQLAVLESMYPGWEKTQQFARAVQQTVIEANKADPGFDNNELSFDATMAVVEEIGERYGLWQDTECRDLKAALLNIENNGSGRVLLKDFYGSALDGAWQFTESTAYLRDLGALDASDPNQWSVIISNYINAPSNCVATSSIYSVCCLNECEPLLGHLELKIGQPDATPARIAEVVAHLPSATTVAPRRLPETLRRRLEEVASHHGGRIPLHGRLFAQWMHHAYPRECPFPRKSGTTSPMTADEWMQENEGESYIVSKDEMQMHMEKNSTQVLEVEDAVDLGYPPVAKAAGYSAVLQAGHAEEAAPLMWTAEEELIVPVPARPREFPVGRSIAFLAAVISVFIGIYQNLGVAVSAMHGVGVRYMLPYSQKQHFC